MASNTNLKAGFILLIIAITASLTLNRFDLIYQLGFVVLIAPVLITVIINTPVTEKFEFKKINGIRELIKPENIPWQHLGKALQYLSVILFAYIMILNK
jgi:uncharacterized membrane protein YkvI